MRHNDKIKELTNRNNIIFEKTVQSKQNSFIKQGRNLSNDIKLRAEEPASNSLILKYHNK